MHNQFDSCHYPSKIIIWSPSGDTNYLFHNQHILWFIFVNSVPQFDDHTVLLSVYRIWNCSMKMSGKQCIHLSSSQSSCSFFPPKTALMFILDMLLVIGGILRYFGNYAFGSILFLFASCSGSFLYVVGCALAVHQFTMNLTKISKMQAGSHREFCQNPEDFSLSDKQLTLLHWSAKHILMFFIAILSTVLNVVLFFIVSSECGCVFTSIDYRINLFGLYVQFAEHPYLKCCGCLDSRWRAMILNLARRDILKEFLNANRRIS